MDRTIKEQKENGVENKELNMKALTEDELRLVDGGSGVYKALNSALTELDEEGIDIGGEYCLEFDGENSWCPQWNGFSSKDKG